MMIRSHPINKYTETISLFYIKNTRGEIGGNE
jgi:hypothetical protein